MNSSAYQVGATNQVKCDISYMPRKILGEKSSIAELWGLNLLRSLNLSANPEKWRFK